MGKSLSLLLSVLHRRKNVCVLLLGVVIFLGTVTVVLAQNPNLVVNPGFESGDLLPGWQKWGYLISDVLVRQCCSHSGAWSAYVSPNGRYVELQQNITVTTRRTYRLQAWVLTSGGIMNAEVGWWADPPGIGKTVCATTNSTSYAEFICELNVPDNTGLFNVHLAGYQPAGNYAYTDDWSLALKTFNQPYGQAFAVLRVNQSLGVRANIWTAQQPGGYKFIASPIGICTTSPCEGAVFGYAETGYNIGTNSKPPNVLQQYVSWQILGGISDGELGKGKLNNNTWYNMGVEYDSSLGRWAAFRDGKRVFTFSDLNFQSGAEVVCGAEGSDYSVPLSGVQCDVTEYRAVGQGWTSYNYNNVQINGNNCVYKPRDFGSIGWGPCY